MNNCSQVETIMKGIGAALGGDDGTQDVSRIFRIPGTFNVKTDRPRLVEIVELLPDRVYDLADFAHYADQTRQDQEQARQEAPHQDGPQTTNVDELKVAKWVKGLILTGDATGYKNDRSERDDAVIRALKRAGYNLNTIEAIFREHPIGDRYREEEQKERGGQKYLQYSFDKEAGARCSDPDNGSTEITEVELLNYAKAGQIGDSRLFIRLFTDKYVYDHAAGLWYRWGGHYWLTMKWKQFSSLSTV